MKFVKMVPEMVEAPGERALWVCETTFKWVVTTFNPEVQPAPYADTVPMCMAHLGTGFGEIKCWSWDPIVTALEPIHRMDLQVARCAHHPLTYQSKYAEWHLAAIRKLEERKFE